ncbi:hypothetical protein QF036_004729 [Arthrobacter globiformis]|nr:hypothetical protein [Arthrobacter globiformis]
MDFYLTQSLGGMGAAGHVELFDRTVEAFDSLSEEEADIYLDGDADDSDADEAGELPERVQAMEDLDAEFESLLETEDIVALNAAWLRGQEGLLVLEDDELTAHIAKRVAALPDLEQRRAEAEEEALENAPEFEVIIRELCDIGGYELQKITMGDPNYDHNGETVLAWRFSTDHGDFLMIEDDDEAFMLNPDTKEIVAAVEFEELGEDLVEA